MNDKIDFLLDSSKVSQTIFDRGFQLYNTNGVELIDFNTITKTASLWVRGMAGRYLNNIDWENNLIETKCACPYNHNLHCKHTVASLLFLKNHSEKELIQFTLNNEFPEAVVQKPNIKKRTSNQPYELDELKIWETIKERHVTEELYSYVKPKLTFSAIEALKIEALLPINHNTLHDNSDYYQVDDKTFRIKFSIQDNKIVSTCNCNELVDKLCKHQAYVIKTLLQTSDIFKAMDEIFVEETIKAHFKKIQLKPTKKNKDLFEFSYVNEQFTLVPSEKGKGLISFKDESTELIKTLGMIDFLQEPEILLTPENTQELTKLSFAIKFNEEQAELFKIVPISAKLNKTRTKLTSTFKEVKYLEEIDSLEATQEEIIFSKQIKELKDYNYYLEHTYTTVNLYEIRQKYLPTIISLAENCENINFFYEQDIYANEWDKLKRNQLTDIQFIHSKLTLNFVIVEKDDMLTLTSYLRNDSISIDLEKDTFYIKGEFFILYQNQHHILTDLSLINDLAYFIDSPVLRVFNRETEPFLKNIVIPLTKKYKVDFSNMKSINKPKAIVAKKKQKTMYLSEMENFVLFKPFVNYNDEIDSNILANGELIDFISDSIKTYERDPIIENEYLDLVKNLHPHFKKQFRTEFLNLTMTDLITDQWIIKAIAKLEANDVIVYGVNDLKGYKFSPYPASISTNISSGEDWFDVEAKVSFGDETVSLRQVQKAIVNNQHYVELSNGKQGVLPEAWLKKMETYLRNGTVKGDNIQIPELRFTLIDELYEELDGTELLTEVFNKREKLLNFEQIKSVNTPPRIHAELRDYQKEGLNWLSFLNEYGWGGILADDMGLGKTLQILALLLKNETKEPSLIVLPTSLIFNWESEIAKFCPDLNYFTHYGKTRAKSISEFEDYEVVITSYGLMTNDIKLFSQKKFNYVILDESQAIKNPTSQRFKAVMLLKGKNKIAMTGTPIENNTFDLFAQMSFANPGFLGSANSFKENFSKPIDINKDDYVASELAKLISPFILRRTKEQVAKELPEKTEDYIFCEMDKEQRAIYDAYKNKIREDLLSRLEKDGAGKSQMMILQGLTKLRQICDSPELLNDEQSYGNDSIKIKKLLEHIEEKTANHKILVFSQFTGMLKLIEQSLKKDQVTYEYLDGSRTSKQRQESVKNFQDNDDCRVFLISIKAGGTGLNLTEADYVYIVDPWWNPAVENQAIDRCYRIGQTKKVIAYRMICKDTIEEKIMKLQESKKKIASDIISVDDEVVKNLTKQDVSDLFS
jgi:SNF2 family DNA or RNA helicase